ncbi:N-acetylmuramoyl-L-alanine amidase [Neobacillus mesonae]|uniref:N-acetylmuramoyl-L-alanine amidase n=1 Tax=Neobacillus mesonae TaxID=1193713 RepID=UPI00203F8BA8|nr:N-acetylmuramoyl-L-alanine amidase [Neobacillus mesonae]MCM3566465.1 N-acetylmuramoyl-L-alanine amidase [Neobacillus mesonae]
MTKKYSLFLVCIILICLAFLPQGKTLAAGTVGVVTIGTDSVNIRSGPDLSYPLTAIAKRGETYEIVQEQGDWIEIRYAVSKTGWVVKWLVVKENDQPQNTASSQNTQSTQISPSTDIGVVDADTLNIRMDPSNSSSVVGKLALGTMVTIYSRQNNWLEIGFADLRGWADAEFINSSGSKPKAVYTGNGNGLKGKIIVIDPGHGGEDKGTTGENGTLEKKLTLRTAYLLYDKLKAAGANVYLTRNSDIYLSLTSRVRIGQAKQADAFISLHYDSNLDPSIRGMTGYYYHEYQKALAVSLFNSTVRQTKLMSHGVRFGDYHVIRENSQNAVLIELGYLSNPEEEAALNSSWYQENAAAGLYKGLVRYFKNH